MDAILAWIFGRQVARTKRGPVMKGGLVDMTPAELDEQKRNLTAILARLCPGVLPPKLARLEAYIRGPWFRLMDYMTATSRRDPGFVTESGDVIEVYSNLNESMNAKYQRLRSKHEETFGFGDANKWVKTLHFRTEQVDALKACSKVSGWYETAPGWPELQRKAKSEPKTFTEFELRSLTQEDGDSPPAQCIGFDDILNAIEVCHDLFVGEIELLLMEIAQDPMHRLEVANFLPAIYNEARFLAQSLSLKIHVEHLLCARVLSRTPRWTVGKQQVEAQRDS